MKSILMILVVLVILSYGNILTADVGLKAGYQSVKGYRVGIFYECRIADSLVLQPEVNYSQREAGDLDVMRDYGFINGKPRYLKYLEVPLLLKYTVNFKGGIKPNVFVGGYAAFRLHPGQVSYDGGLNGWNEDYGFWSYTRRFKDVDYGLVLGLGVETSIRGGKMKLHYEARYTMGFPVTQYTSFPYVSCFPIPEKEDKGNERTRSLAVSVGLSF